jgi:hypothetical protein
MNRLGVLLWMVLLVWSVSAQTDDSQEAVRRQRISRIDFYHVSVGASVAMNRNYSLGPQLSFGVGSFRNILNADVGIRYLFEGALLQRGAERVSLQQLPLFVSLHVNAIRWRTGSFYLGAEMAYVPTVVAQHRLPDGQLVSDIHIGKNHFTPAAKLGFRQGDCDFSLFYEYDMKPSFDQKYIFETVGYDYDALKYSIFERMRLGIRFLYHFNF